MELDRVRQVDLLELLRCSLSYQVGSQVEQFADLHCHSLGFSILVAEDETIGVGAVGK